MKRQAKKYQEDDGRVVCKMNVEGMPWYARGKRRGENAPQKVEPVEQLRGPEAWRFTWSALFAALLMVLVFSVTWVLFVLFCTKIWFR
jgi:hypothetical protein